MNFYKDTFELNWFMSNKNYLKIFWEEGLKIIIATVVNNKEFVLPCFKLCFCFFSFYGNKPVLA